MRAAVIFGLGTSSADLKPFREGSQTEWIEGLPASSRDADAVLVFGGDGTIHRHLSALVELQLPVLIVPAGSGNDFARALGLRSQSDSRRVWRQFEAGKVEARAIDLGVVFECGASGDELGTTESAERDGTARPSSRSRRHYFCGVAACGLDSAVARLANEMPRWLRGHGGYVLALIRLLPKLPTFWMQVRSLENPEENERLTLLAAFANTPFYGDGMKIAPQADFTDGKVDVCRILFPGSYRDTFKLFCMFPTIYFGKHLNVPEVEYSRAERVALQTNERVEIYADGEFVCSTPAEISVAPGALRVIMSR